MERIGALDGLQEVAIPVLRKRIRLRDVRDPRTT